MFPSKPCVEDKADINSEMAAIIERQCCDVPELQPIFEEMERFLELDHLDGHSLFGKLPKLSSYRQFVDPTTGEAMTFESWNSHFPGNRRKEHAEAFTKFRTCGPLSRSEAKRWAKVDLFPKREKLAKCGIPHAPRAISAQRPKTTPFVGPPVTVLQSLLHWLWRGDDDLPICFAAGSTVDHLSAVFDRMYAEGGEFFENDMSNYDSTVVTPYHVWVLRLLDHIGFEDDPLWRELFIAQTEPLDGQGKSGCLFTTPGNMKSGVPPTCLLNSIVNALTHLFAISRNSDIVDLNGNKTLRATLAHVRMLVMGDDNLGCVQAKVDWRGVETTMRQLGMMPKLKVCDDPEQAVFLNMLPYPIGGGKHLFAPMIGRLFTRWGWAVTEQRDVLAYNCALGKGMVDRVLHVPILKALCDRYIRCGSRKDGGKNHDRGLELDPRFARKHFGYVNANISKGKVIVTPQMTEAVEMFIQRRYGWSTQRQRSFVEEIEGWPDPPAFIRRPWFENTCFPIDCPE